MNAKQDCEGAEMLAVDSNNNEEEEVRPDKEKRRRSSFQVTRQYSWSVSQTRDGLSQSPFFSIPTEILVQIFRSLSTRDLRNVSLVCRSFKMIADQVESSKSQCNKSRTLWSKSSKEIAMDWIYIELLRKQELKKIENESPNKRASYEGSSQYSFAPVEEIRSSTVTGFHQHPNSSPEMLIQLSVDIDRIVPQLISFWAKVSAFQSNWRQSAIVAQMIMRYHRFMQLKASLPQNIRLVPTLDIEIIWQIHLLRPRIYQSDCLRLFHRVIDHSLVIDTVGQFVKEQAFIDTCRLYEERFGEQYCPLTIGKEKRRTARKHRHCLSRETRRLIPMYSYWDETYFKFSSELPNDYQNPFSFTEADVILDGNWLGLCKRRMPVTVSKNCCDLLDEFDLSLSAMNRLKKSYERFLYMSVKYPPLNGFNFVQPTHTIDIIWQSHMQEPLKYAADCVRLVGYIIDPTSSLLIEKNQMHF